jgi:hypothetical protein
MGDVDIRTIRISVKRKHPNNFFISLLLTLF